MISHDRWFLDRVATHILAYEDDSQAVFFEGNYTEYEADRKSVWAKPLPSRTVYATKTRLIWVGGEKSGAFGLRFCVFLEDRGGFIREQARSHM